MVTIICFIVTNLFASIALLWPLRLFEVVVIVAMLTGMVTLAIVMADEFYDSLPLRRRARP